MTEHETTDEKIEKICIESYGYSPSYVASLSENFGDVADMVEHYLDVAGSLEEKHRKKIAKISFKKNKIKIMLSRLTLFSDQLVNDARKAALDGKKSAPKNGRADETKKILDKTEKEFETLLEDIDEFVSDLEARC
jgi:hypothetical protein